MKTRLRRRLFGISMGILRFNTLSPLSLSLLIFEDRIAAAEFRELSFFFLVNMGAVAVQ